MKIRPNVPMAIQVANLLRQRLRQNNAEGGRLPGEHDLASELGVSRGTVRQALAVLEQEGVIFRQQGNGTFANRHVLQINARVDTAYEFSELIETAGFEASVERLDVKQETATAEVIQRLSLKSDVRLLAIRKVFLASGQRAIYVVERIPMVLIQEPYDETEFSEPIFEFLDERCNVRVAYILSEIIPCVADGELSERLQIPEGQPALKFVEVFYSRNNKPLALVKVYFRDPIIRFHALRKMSYAH